MLLIFSCRFQMSRCLFFYLGSFHVVIQTQQAITSILQQSNSKSLEKWGVTKGRHCTEECRRLTSTTALPFSPWKQTSLLVFVLMRHILISFTSAESLKVRFLKEAVLSLQPVQALFILNGREHIPLLMGVGGVGLQSGKSLTSAKQLPSVSSPCPSSSC